VALMLEGSEEHREGRSLRELKLWYTRGLGYQPQEQLVVQ